MRCLSVNTALSYNLSEITKSFKGSGLTVKPYHRSLFIAFPKRPGTIFVFSEGCVVLWGLTSREEKSILESLKPFAKDLLSDQTRDYFIYHYGESTSITSHERFPMDVIYLDSDNVQLKLAISYALARSIKLESYEDKVLKTINQNRSLTGELAKSGRISLPRDEISKRMGEIFLERSSINLNTLDIDVTKYFWKNPSFESYYLLAQDFLDMPLRIDALNQKLDVLHEILDMLKSQLEHRHSSILEYIIILLILTEIIFNLFHITLR